MKKQRKGNSKKQLEGDKTQYSQGSNNKTDTWPQSQNNGSHNSMEWHLNDEKPRTLQSLKIPFSNCYEIQILSERIYY